MAIETSQDLKKQIRRKEQQLRRLDPEFVEKERAQFKEWYGKNQKANVASSLKWNRANKDKKNATNSKYAKSPKGLAAAKARRDKKKLIPFPGAAACPVCNKYFKGKLGVQAHRGNILH